MFKLCRNKYTVYYYNNSKLKLFPLQAIRFQLFMSVDHSSLVLGHILKIFKAYMCVYFQIFQVINQTPNRESDVRKEHRQRRRQAGRYVAVYIPMPVSEVVFRVDSSRARQDKIIETITGMQGKSCLLYTSRCV